MKTLIDIPTSTLAGFLGSSDSYASNVKAGRQKVSSKVALKIHKHFEIPLWEIRPDIYPIELFGSDSVVDGTSLDKSEI